MSHKPALEHVTFLRARLVRMLVIDVACAVVAMGAIIGWLSLRIAWMAWPFAGATLVGFAAQIWFLIDFARTRPPP